MQRYNGVLRVISPYNRLREVIVCGDSSPERRDQFIKGPMRIHLKQLLTRAIEKTAKGADLSATEIPPLILELPKQREFGDLATNIAMHWAKAAKKPPRVIAEAIVKNIEDPEGVLARIDIAGPGFLN